MFFCETTATEGDGMNTPRNYPVRLNHVHASGFSPNYAFPRHYQKNHQLYLVFEGTIVYEADGTDLVLHAGDGLWLAPGCLRAPRSGGGCGSYLVADFNTHHTGFCPRGAERIRLDAESLPHARALYNAVCENNDDAILQLLFARFCLAVDSRLILPESTVTESRLDRDEQAVRTVEKLMEANLGNPLPFETLCRLAHSSRAGVVRSFRRRLGVAPMEYYRQRRLERAKELLRNGLSISEVAAATGFSSTQHLATVFRRQFRQTPSEWIRICTKQS